VAKLLLAPESTRYSASPGGAVERRAVGGGLSRVRRDQLGAPFTVEVGWLADENEADYLLAFQRHVGADEFQIDLIIEGPVPTEHTARFLPGSLPISGVSGKSHPLRAMLEVSAPVRDAVADMAVVNARAAAVGNLPQLVLEPNARAFSSNPGETMLQAKYGPGASGLRVDDLRAAALVGLEWNVGPADFAYLQAFYFTALAEGALPFLLWAVHDSSAVRQYRARLIPGSFGLEAVAGITYTVKAAAEIVPMPNALVDLWTVELFDPAAGTDGSELFDALEELVNVTWPQV
jgi:hypothetical protein